MTRQHRYLPYILLILLCLWLFLPGVTSIPAFDRDESRFVQASKQMIETHNYQKINFQGAPRHLKPPGIYWLQAASTQQLGHGSLDKVWTYRIPSVIGGLLAVLLLYGLFNSALGREHAFLAAGVLSSTLLLVLESHMGTTDAMLLACMVLMQGGLWRVFAAYKKSGRAPWYWAGVFWLGMAAGLFIKGTSPFIGLLTVVGICIAERSMAFIKQLRILSGLAGVVLISLAWIIPFSQVGHSNFLWDMLTKDALPKVFGSAQGHGAPPGYFLLLLPLMFWPCSVLLFRGFTLAWQERKQPLNRFLFAWIIPCWIFIALIHTKLPEYALPLYPALALITARLCLNKVEIKGRLKTADVIYRSIWLCLTLVLAVAFPLMSYLLLKHFSISSIVIGVSILGLGVVLFKLSSLRFYRSCILLSLIGGVFIYGFIYQFYLEAMQPMWLTPKVEAVIKQQAIPISAANPLFVSDYNEPSLVFYLGTHRVKFAAYDAIFNSMRLGTAQYALMKDKHLQPLKQYAHKYGFAVTPLAFIRGFNYEHGSYLKLVLVKKEP
ncbi:MAG: hypothetical protein COB66_08635 [Coxiella sp. (in: Bacteria)]|nr:MAG: hypothetical protein COB66_08635 [Coxiella sp. (in: g-proteobacteria)]